MDILVRCSPGQILTADLQLTTTHTATEERQARREIPTAESHPRHGPGTYTRLLIGVYRI